MKSFSAKRSRKGGRKVRVAFRQNRSKPPRTTNWTQRVQEAEGLEVDTDRSESVSAKGALSRRRTITIHEGRDGGSDDLACGVVVAMRGLYADVDDGEHVWPCTVRRVLRTRRIKERHPVTVGDRVRFRIEGSSVDGERAGVIEMVEPRSGQLHRFAGRRIHTIVANVEQAIIVSSAAQPSAKPHLIDRYLVASHAGGIKPVVCMNKADLDRDDAALELLGRYARIGYATLYTSAITGVGMDALKDTLQNCSSVIVGQSGVGKSSLLNAVQPGLRLKLGDITAHTGKGRHTTTTAGLIRLELGGYVVDTPGMKSFAVSMIGRNELEAFFVEFVEHVPHCKFSDCTHIHEEGCAIKKAVQSGGIHPQRYESYVRLYEEPSSVDGRSTSRSRTNL